MTNDLPTWSALGVAALLAAYALAQLRPGKKRPAPQQEEERTLAEVSRLWTGEVPEVDFKEIARIWRTTPEARAEPKPPPVVRHPEVQAFHARWLAHPVVREGKREIIEALLVLLDREGDCPSVAKKNAAEAEKRLDPNVFDRLAGIPLWRHSLEVATRLAASVNQAMLIPDALIAGLGHDLGKIPAYQDSLYLTGDHPVISLIVLNKIPGYEAMANRDEVSLAIRQHHLLHPESALGRALKDADHQVRLAEISSVTPPLAPEEPPPAAIAPAPQAKPSAKKPRPPLPPSPIRETKSPVATSTALSNLDLVQLLDGLKGRINRLNKNRWSVISVPEGYVLAQSDAVWEEAKRLSRNAPEFLAADGNEENRRHMLNSIIQRLTEEQDAIAAEQLEDGYHTVQCLIITASGRAMKVPLVPFRAEAFGAVPSALEAIKPAPLLKMVHKVKLKGGESGE